MTPVLLAATAAVLFGAMTTNPIADVAICRNVSARGSYLGAYRSIAVI